MPPKPEVVYGCFCWMWKLPSGVLPVAPVETQMMPTRLAVLDDHEDLPALVDLDVRGRARVARLDQLGAVELAPARGVEDVGARAGGRPSGTPSRSP